MDVSSSQIIAEQNEIAAVPLVQDITEYINLQAGVENDMIRGGGLDQTGFVMDGLMVVDNRANKPMVMVNLSAVKELTIIKGGFNAEYGNVRSGLINILTKEGGPNRYSGSIDFRISPPHLKHNGASLFDPDNYYLRPYLDPQVMWIGTEAGWDEETQSQYPSFMGWNAYSEQVLSDDNPDNDMTPEQARDVFLWEHRAEGSGALGQKEGEYGVKPDWNLDLSLGGPVPVLNKFLGDLSFFASHRQNWEEFALPTVRDYYKESNSMLKFTSRLSPSMKLSIEGLYGEINSVSQVTDSDFGNDAYVHGGEAILYSELTTGEEAHENRGGNNLYWPSSLTPFDVYRSMQGISFDHVLSSKTFYNIRISNTRVKNYSGGPDRNRDLTIVKYFGSKGVDERPYGFVTGVGGEIKMADGMLYADIGGSTRDYSEVNTIAVKFDLTSQINRYNQVKAGFIYNYDDLYSDYARNCIYCPGDSWHVLWNHYPYRVGAYVQDKLEFEGLIANVGLRLDYNEPNTDWYTVDRYSPYFQKQYKDVFTQLTPTTPAEGHLKVSPRLGVSHPITEHAKLYFNYGHFYSMAPSDDMYMIRYGRAALGVTYLGNPSALMPKTTAYELGFEYDVAQMVLIHLNGFYRDIVDQTGGVNYVNYDGSVDYTTVENNNYMDIRGFELRIDKRFGRWVTGWLNYTYQVETSGYIGRETYYQDQRLQLIEGLQNPYQEIPLARPYMRANIMVMSPSDWGPSLGRMKPLANFQISTLFNWKAGRYMTWDPLETYVLQQNVQWRPQWNVDMRISKLARWGRYNITLFADIRNLFNLKYLQTMAFVNEDDSRSYYESLHLPMYAGEEYKAEGYTAGDDKPGDVKSDDKPYIDMPNREFLTYLGLRSVFFGLKLEF